MILDIIKFLNCKDMSSSLFSSGIWNEYITKQKVSLMGHNQPNFGLAENIRLSQYNGSIIELWQKDSYIVADTTQLRLLLAKETYKIL